MSAVSELETAPSCRRQDAEAQLAILPGHSRAIAFVDVKTTGPDPERHEILELAIVRADAKTLEVIDEFVTLARPERLEGVDPTALGNIGFLSAAWKDAPPLPEALARAAPLLTGATIAGHNVGLAWSFIATALGTARIPLPSVGHYQLDTVSLGWPLLAAGDIESLSLDALASHFGLERCQPHRALNDARLTLTLCRRLLERMVLGGKVVRLPGDEREILDTLAERLNAGRQEYGPWHVNDGRDYPAEAFTEVMDALHYCAAALVQHRRRSKARMPRVYICHSFTDDIPVNKASLRALCHCLVERGVLPVAPQLYLPEFVDQEVERDRTRALCLELIDTCDELRIFGDRITDEMMREIRHAKARGIAVRREKEVLA